MLYLMRLLISSPISQMFWGTPLGAQTMGHGVKINCQIVDLIPHRMNGLLGPNSGILFHLFSNQMNPLIGPVKHKLSEMVMLP